MLVIERTLFKFDVYEFVKEQITFKLKKCVSYLNQLSNLYDRHFLNSKKEDPFNEIISEVGTARQSNKLYCNQEVAFILKDCIEIKPISSINPIEKSIENKNNTIQKNRNELLKIQSFEPEETYFFNSKKEEESNLNIRLKELFFTPTVLSIIYKVLRTNSENHEISLNEHLAMNILVCISNFSKESESESQESEESKETTINYNSSLIDLISQLKRTFFYFNIDEHDKATIKNTISNKVLKTLKKTKIISEEESPKSFIDHLQEKGEIGRRVLSQMSKEIEDNDT